MGQPWSGQQGDSVLAASRQFTYRDSVSIGAILTQALTIIRRYPWPTLGATLLIAILPVAIMALFFVAIGLGIFGGAFLGPTGLSPMLTGFLFFIAFGSALMIGNLGTQAAMTRAMVAHAQGDPVTFRGCVGASFGKVLPLLGLSIIVTAAMFIGFMFFLVPGIIVAMIWSVAAPALVAEDLGVFAALSRSSSLTQRLRARIFGTKLLVFILFAMASSVLDRAGAALGLSGLSGLFGSSSLNVVLDIAGSLFSLATWTVVMAYWGALSAGTYLELRQAREGPLSNNLADIFA